MPIDRSLYPADWDDIALEVKGAACWFCSKCNRPCRMKGETIEKFASCIREAWGDEAAAEVLAHPQRFILTVAHYPDRNPMNCVLENLRALCAPCHLRLDARHHAETRRRKRQLRPGQIAMVGQ